MNDPWGGSIAGLIPPVPPFSLVRSVAGAESGPQRALSSPTAAAGLVTITSREEPQLPQPAPVTITATMSSEAETQQPPAAPPAAPALSAADTKPGTTGSGAGSGGPGGLTSAAPAGGDKKVIGEDRTGTGVGREGSLAAEPLPEAGRAGGRAAGGDRLGGARPPLPQAPPHSRTPARPVRVPEARLRRLPRPLQTPRGRAPLPLGGRAPPTACAAGSLPSAPARPPAACARARTPLFRPPPAPFRVYSEGAARRLRRPEWAGRLPFSHVLAAAPAARGPRAHPARARAPGFRSGGLTHVDRAAGRRALERKAVRWPPGNAGATGC